MRYTLLLLVLSFFIFGCGQDYPTAPLADSFIQPEQFNQPPLVNPIFNPPAQTSKQMGVQSGQLPKEEAVVEKNKLKTSQELDELLNGGIHRPPNSQKPRQSVKSQSFYNYSYYEYNAYWEYYGYDYTYDYYASYEEYGYYDYSYYEYDYFEYYENYSFRSSVEIWSSYSWPSGYGLFTCYAEDAFGDIYYGYGYPAYEAEDSALAVCEDSSGDYCVPLGCE